MKLCLTLLILAASLSLGACNTVKGLGQDLQTAGEKIENAAKK